MRALPADLYNELLEYFEAREDVRDTSDGPAPNAAMNFVTRLKELRGEQTKILVTVSGGNVTGVHATAVSEDAEAIVHDYDELDDRDDMTEHDFDRSRWFRDGQTVQRFRQQVQLGNDNYRELA